MIKEYFSIIIYCWIAIAILIFPLLIKVRAPYGRHASKSWGPVLSNRLGWILMEFPSLLLFVLLFFTGDVKESAAVWIFFALWVIHYANRIFIFPFRTRTKGKKMPMLIVLLAMFFNLVNGFINGFWLGHMSQAYYLNWLSDPRFIIGIIIFFSGFIINQSADSYLIKLRKGNKEGYYIPHGKLFNHISCPNFLGEIIEWTGFALMTWALPGLSFAIWTAANLIPRALHHHGWYRTKFDDYPSDRKAIFPFII